MNSTFSSTDYEASQWCLNWRQIAEDIRGQQIKQNHFTGMSFVQQAKTLGLEWSTYQRYLEGSEPKYSQANALLRLHSDMCGEASTQKRLSESMK